MKFVTAYLLEIANALLVSVQYRRVLVCIEISDYQCEASVPLEE
jgi:hypothetical protein